MEGYGEEYGKLKGSLLFRMKQFGKPPKGLNPEEEKAEAEKIKDEIDKFNEIRLDIKRDFAEQGIFRSREKFQGEICFAGG